jgi:hypothetical protein
MITATVYPRKKLLSRKQTWGLRIQGGNGQKIGHDYNEPASAIAAATLLFGDDEVVLHVQDANGNVTDRRRIR